MKLRIFALSDLHLSFDKQGNSYKPMGIFGAHWEAHSRKIAENWRRIVAPNDIVLLPGDLSWAMTLQEAKSDLAYLHQLPGRKIIIRGNHELWWNSITQVRRALPPSISAIQNDHILLSDDVAVCGTRGWQCPEENFTDAQNAKIFAREIGRLQMSLASVPKTVATIIVMLHFPPVNYRQEMSPFVKLMQDYEVCHCIYGHLHAKTVDENYLMGRKWGINFHLVSADYLHFSPKCIYNKS